MLNRKRKTRSPCPECFLHQGLCICAHIPRIETKTKLTLIIHAKELKRTTNTGRLALKALVNSEIRIRGANKVALNLSDLITPEYQSLLFFPSEESIEITTEYLNSFNQPIHFLVPDGNWRQASKVCVRHPELNDLPRVMISKPNLANFHLRKESSPEGMATLQAIAEAYRLSECEETYEKLIRVYNLKLQNTLKGRGKI